jgi:CRISPR-associated protein Cas2
MRRHYLVTYDICDAKRLRRVFKTMKGFGAHLQFSVFQCDLPDIDVVRMKAALTEIIDLGPTESHPVKRIESMGIKAEWEERRARVM